MTLPIVSPAGTKALIFNDRAWDWNASAKPLPVPADGRFMAQVPALGAWLVLIPVKPEAIAATYNLPAAPAPAVPAVDASITDGPLNFQWTGAGKFQWEIAREAIFRPQDRVKLAEVTGTSYTLDIPLAEKSRYFWRVCAVDAQGRRGSWSAPRPFLYRWPEYAAKAFPPQGSHPAGWPRNAWTNPRQPRLAGGNLGANRRATCAPPPAPSTARTSVTGPTAWMKGNSNFKLPAEWCVIWPKPTSMSSVKIHWFEELPPLEFTLQVGDDGKTWTDLYHQAENIGATTEFTLPQPTAARYFRILITRAKSENGAVGIREVFLK